MKFFHFVCVASLCALGATSFAKAQAAIDQAGFEKMIRELESHATKNPDYEYPITVEFKTDEVLNAYAHLTAPAKDGEKPRATVTIYKKFADFLGNDPRLLRAVLAHEISHLSHGHVSNSFKPSDLNLIHTRMQELDADATGASLLAASGYDKKDMVDFLTFAEDKLRGLGGWMGESISDHPSFQARIANIQDNPLVAQSLAEFDYGLMFLDNRQYVPAANAFQRSIAKQPDFVPAYVNVAQAKLAFYYEEMLPRDIRDSWFRADFGGFLTNRGGGGSKGADLAPARKAYRDAVDAIKAALAKDSQNGRALELQALAQVLDPDGDSSNLVAGTASLAKLSTTATSNVDRLRAANNAALGLARQGKSALATNLMLEAQSSAKVGDNYTVTLILASNLARTRIEDIPATSSPLAASVVRYFLNNSTTKAPNWDKAKAFYAAICAKNHLEASDVTPAKIAYCAPLSLIHHGETLSLLSPIGDFITKYGKAMSGTQYDKLYPDLLELVWDSNELTAIMQGDQLLRVTSFSPTAELVLKSTDVTDDTQIHVKVGMTKAEINAIFSLEPGVETNLVKGGELQTWLFFPDQNFGLLFSAENKLIGITVTPVAS